MSLTVDDDENALDYYYIERERGREGATIEKDIMCISDSRDFLCSYQSTTPVGLFIREAEEEEVENE